MMVLAPLILPFRDDQHEYQPAGCEEHKEPTYRFPINVLRTNRAATILNRWIFGARGTFPLCRFGPFCSLVPTDRAGSGRLGVGRGHRISPLGLMLQ
jgi:hypothetical protein